MRNKVTFHTDALEEYINWASQDKKQFKRINKLIRDIIRNGYEGIGKPEPLKGDMSGWWSRHIDDANRLVYRLEDNDKVEILQCKGHYN